jgi:L-iditol 2-dehydrogenase
MKGVAKLAHGEGHVAYAERPDVVAGPGEVVIDLLAAGICGTDLHIAAGEYPCLPPVTMAPEFCGRVAELGPGVESDWAGARDLGDVLLDLRGVPLVPLGAAEHLPAARLARVARRRRVRAAHPRAGAQSPQGAGRFSDRAAAICEPLACVCNSLSDPASVDAGDEVLVIGPGAIGLLAAQVARGNGGRVHVRGTATDEARLELARSFGFETSTADRPFAGDAPDVVVECSGAGPAIATALEVISRGGTLVQMGLRGAPVTVPFDEICFKELRVRSGFAANPVAWRRALRLLDDDAIQLEPLISGTAELADFERVFARSRAADGVKFVLVP